MWTKVSICLLHDFNSMDCPCAVERPGPFPPAFNASGHTVLLEPRCSRPGLEAPQHGLRYLRVTPHLTLPAQLCFVTALTEQRCVSTVESGIGWHAGWFWWFEQTGRGLYKPEQFAFPTVRKYVKNYCRWSRHRSLPPSLSPLRLSLVLASNIFKAFFFFLSLLWSLNVPLI